MDKYKNKTHRCFILTVVIIILSGCASQMGDPGFNKSVDPEKKYAVVRTFFATDRNVTGNNEPDKVFGDGRGSSDLNYGSCDVSIPRDHRMGELESPSIWKLEFREDPKKHIVLLETSIKPRETFYSEIAEKVASFPKSSALVFVHGFNVSFEDAARRTAQMSYDLGFEGAPIFYSWPSQGELFAYTVDEQNIEWSQANIKNFLEDFFKNSNIENVYLIAHSMGNRGLARAVAALMTEKPDYRTRLKEVILTAPDIDSDVFRRDIAPALVSSGCPVTLYSSSKDFALKISKEIHKYPRAGDSGKGLVIVPGIETIDATRVDTSLIGHSYFAESKSVLSDIFYVIRCGQGADYRFGLKPAAAKAGKYWKFK